MIYELTKEQLHLMEQVKQEWLDRIFKCETKLDEKKVKPLVEWLYQFSGLSKPEVIFVQSPLGAQYVANILKNVGRNVRENVGQNVRQNVGQNVRENVGENVWENVRENVWENVRENVRENVCQ